MNSRSLRMIVYVLKVGEGNNAFRILLVTLKGRGKSGSWNVGCGDV
jgi:hypothetical protein